MDWTSLQLQNEMYQGQLAEYAKWLKQKEILEKQVEHAQDNIEHYERLLNEAYKQIELHDEPTFLSKIKAIFQRNEMHQDELLELAATRELKLTEAQIVKEDLQDEYVDLIYKLNAIDEREIRSKIEINRIQMKIWLEQNAPQKATSLQLLLEEKQLAQTLLKEIDEAIHAGNIAYKTLIDASNELNTAHSYSTWDTFLGGGVFATHLKHEKVRVSNTYLHKAQRDLQRFQNELLDLKAVEFRSLDVSFDGFVTFSDYFFDDIFSAYSIHSKINSARSKITAVLDDVSNARIKLNAQKEVANEKLKAIHADILTIYDTDLNTLQA